MIVSKGIVFSYEGEKPNEMIYIQGLPKSWTEGMGIYLNLEEANELVEGLQRELKSVSKIIF